MSLATARPRRRMLLVSSSALFLGAGLAVAAVGGRGSGAESPPPGVSQDPTLIVVPATSEVAPPAPVAASPLSPHAPPAPGPAPARAPRAWRPTGPADVRLWTNGDSTSYYMSYWTMQMVAALGGSPVQPEAEYKISSGLVRRDFFDWFAYTDRQLAAFQPTVVVFMVGANDALQGGGLERYRSLVADMMDSMNGPTRRVIWVGQPNVGRAELQAVIPALNAIFREEAEARPWVTFVDTWALTSDGVGNYAASLPDGDGSIEVLRADDGVHFTSAGGKRLATAVVAAIFSPTREETAELEAAQRALAASAGTLP